MATALEVVKRFYASIDADDQEQVLSLLSEDVKWRLVGPATIPYFGTYSGIDGVKEFFALLDDHEQIDEFEPVEYLDGVNSVTVLGKEKCTSKVTGKTFRTEWAQIFSVSDGKITRFLEYGDTVPIDAAYRT